MKPVEIRMAYNLPDGRVEVHTGVYVFAHTKLEDVAKLVKNAERVPDFVEIDIAQFNEVDE